MNKLQQAQANATKRLRTDEPGRMAEEGAGSVPVYLCRHCGARLPLDDETARSLAPWFPPGNSRWPCPDCAQRRHEDQRRRTQEQAEAARQAERARIAGDMPAILGERGVPLKWRGARLDQCPDLPNPLVDAARLWAHQPEGIVLITGPVGSGKTYLAVAMLAAVMDAYSIPAAHCRYVGERVYLDGLKAGFGRDDEAPRYAPPDDPRRAAVLVLDDIGSAYLTDWGRSEVAGLIEVRHGGGLATILTSNLTLDQIASTIDARTASRIAESGYLWRLSGQDLRRHGSVKDATA